jgi:hypothetical protein
MSEGKWEEPCIGPGCTFSPWCNFRKYWDAGKKKECNLSDSDLAAIRECIESEGKLKLNARANCSTCIGGGKGTGRSRFVCEQCDPVEANKWEPQGEGE